MGFWKTFLACLLAIVVSSIVSFIFSLIVFVSVIVAITASSTDITQVSDNSVLTIDMGKPIVEHRGDDMMKFVDFSSMSFNPPMSTRDVVLSIEKAAIDPKIQGIYLDIPLVVASSYTTLYEIREALESFKTEAPDKFIISYGDGYSQGALYLSSVADKVFLNPSGAVSWQGMAVMPMFYKGTLDKLGITPQVIRHGKFKGAVEPYILSKLSDENRLQYQTLIDSNWDYMVKEISTSRGITTQALQNAATNLTIQTSLDALKIGMVDELLYADQVDEWIENTLNAEDYNTLDIHSYSSSTNVMAELNEIHSSNEIEVIYASGAIVDVGSGNDEIIGKELAHRLAMAREDEEVKAVVVRVNSPGGSALASDVIWREMQLLKDSKPLIISMGDYAASGGYWISTPATKIVSAPMTLTGSIGVFGILFNVEQGAKEHLGITVEAVTTNPSADVGSMFRNLSPLERKVIQNGVDTIYNNFLVKVSNGRGMTVQEVDKIAEGRVWTGLDAKRIGLVDEIGTLNRAIEIAATEAGVQGDYSVVSRVSSDFSFFDALSSGISTVVDAVIPPIVSDTKELIERENRTIQARLPYDLKFIE